MSTFSRTSAKIGEIKSDIKSDVNAMKAEKDLHDIKSDVNSLKENTIALAHSLAETGKARAEQLTEVARQNLADLKVAGKRELNHLERTIQDKPVQSVLVAAGVGFLLSLLMGRR